MSDKGVWIEDKKIQVLKNWLEPKFMQDIQVFLRFTNIYQHFIQGFSKIARLLILMLRMSFLSWSAESSLSNMADNAKVDNDGDKNETIERLSHLSNSKKRKGYLNSDLIKAFI